MKCCSKYMCTIRIEFETCECEGLSVCVTSASLPDLVSRVAPHIFADCSTQMTSSMVFVVTPTLLRHPIFEGKFITSLIFFSGLQVDRNALSCLR